MPWGQDESDLVWTNLDLICNPKESKAQETEKNKETKKKQRHQKNTQRNKQNKTHNVFQTLV